MAKIEFDVDNGVLRNVNFISETPSESYLMNIFLDKVFPVTTPIKDFTIQRTDRWDELWM